MTVHRIGLRRLGM